MTGEPRYDKFFTELNAMLVAVEEGEREIADVRGALARRLGLQEDVSAEVLGKRLRERTARLAAEGLTLELELTGLDEIDDQALGISTPEAMASEPEEAGPGPASTELARNGASPGASAPTATLRTPGREPERRELRLLKVLAQAALSGAMLYVDMGRMRGRVPELLRELAELRAGLPSAFPEAGRRDMARGKLDEAEELLPILGERSREVSNAADILVAMLDEAANTAPHAAAGRRRAHEQRRARQPAPSSLSVTTREHGKAGGGPRRSETAGGVSPRPGIRPPVSNL